MKRLAAAFAGIAILTSISGCGLGPRNFRKITHPAPLVRARAMSLGYGQPDAVVLPALIERLNDSDVVVRLAAHEELKRRTGRDFGYLPWGGTEERSRAINRWREWLAGGRTGYAPAPAQPRKTLPRPSPQGRPGGEPGRT
jgi:hypothetical protein